MTAPVTLTWASGWSVTFSRVGDTVTGVLVTTANPASGETLTVPPVFMPVGEMRTSSYNSATAPSLVLTLNEISAAGPVGITAVGAAAAGTMLTIQWLADASTADPPSDDELEEFYVHTVMVETYQGTNGYGEDLFAPPVAISGFMDDSRRLVRGKEAEQVISESQFYTRPENGALFTAESRVTADGIDSRVIRTNVNTSGNLDLPDHAVISLT